MGTGGVMHPPFVQLLGALREVAHLEAAEALLGWDEETLMPAGAAEARAEQLATVSRMAHECFTRPQVGEWLDASVDIGRECGADSFEAGVVRVARREYAKATRLPGDLVHALAKATSQAFHAWARARRDADFAALRPYLERVLSLTLEKADRLGWRDERYDALLDLYEPGYTAADVQALFAGLYPGLSDLLRRILERDPRVPDGFVSGDYPEERQEELSRRVLGAIGFAFERGRLDRSAHPFTTSIGAPEDVRVTTRYDRSDFMSSLYAAIHEGGHGLYDQGFPEAFRATPLAAGASLGCHESQSRLWENMVGRSREFARFLLPLARDVLGGPLERVDADGLYAAVNKVRRSSIRVEADEVTYNLHILLRFELERRLCSGQLMVAELPAAWNEAAERYIGLRPANDAEGVLQDVHWAHGLFGYFPTYTLGNCLAGALWRRIRTAVPGVEGELARGEFAGVLGWLRENVHAFGAMYMPKDLVVRVTGEPLSAGPFLDYLTEKYTALYGL